MPWGQFQGTPVAELPDSYLEWLNDAAEVRSMALRQAIAAEYNRRSERRRIANLLLDHMNMCPDPSLAARWIEVGYRALAKTEHPDAGGSHDRMVAVHDVKEWLEHLLNGAYLHPRRFNHTKEKR